MDNNESLAMYFKAFRLPSIAALVEPTLLQAEAEDWGYRKFLTHLCEHEYQDREQRRTERLLKQSGLGSEKTFESAEAKLWPQKIRRILPSLIDGDFVHRAENLVALGLPGRGKTHLLEALGRELILRHQFRVLNVRAAVLIERLLQAKKELRLEKELQRLDRFDVIVVDELGYCEHRRDEMEVFFLFLSARHERRSVMLSSNLVFSQWDRIFKDAMLGMAAVDRLVQRSIILEFTNTSIRERLAKERNKR
jgi:DNA replication protein DnaC